MYLLNICESSGVLRTFYILKICLSIVTTILPIIVIAMFIVDAFKAVTDGKRTAVSFDRGTEQKYSDSSV